MNIDKQFTREEFIEAIRKNGFQQGETTLFYKELDGSFSACALGQGLINIGVVDYEEDILPAMEAQTAGTYFYPKGDVLLYDLIDEVCGEGFSQTVYELNDTQHLSCEEIADRLTIPLAPYPNRQRKRT